MGINWVLKKFNDWFNVELARYTRVLSAIVNRRTITFLILGAFCLGTWYLNTRLPSGFIPNEDQGVFYAIILTPPGSTLERTDEVTVQLQKIASGIEDIKSVSSMAGFEILTEGTGSNSGTCLVNLKNWGGENILCRK